MRKYFIAIFLMLVWLVMSVSPTAAAAPPAMSIPPTLAISEIKMTGDEFVVLKNNTGDPITDLSTYWLNEFNSYNPSAIGSSGSGSSQQLPPISLANGDSVLLNSAGMATCGAAVVGKLSVNLGDSNGYLQVVKSSQNASGIIQTPVDYVSWSSKSNGVIQNAPSHTSDPAGMYYRTATGWQLADIDSSNSCQLDVASLGSIDSGLTQSTSPVPSVAGTSAGGIGLPVGDKGLAAPQISEVMPNPAPPKTDADDEFIELYNPNDKAFDLSGFVLQVGTTTTHKYTFPNGTSIQPKQFSAFYSSDTGLSLNNSGGQVKLFDPAGDLLEQTDPYGTAKDGYAWVSADGLWRWTTTSTPDAANVVTAPTSKNKKSSGSSGNKSVKGAATAATVKTSVGGGPSSSSVSLHPLVLAGVGVAAVVYALYEYRHDLANRLYKFRRYRETRRTAG